MNQQASSLEEVYRSTYRSCVQRGLALEAGGIPYEIQERATGWAILVAAETAAQARSELEAYGQEDVAPPITAHIPRPDSGWAGALGYAAVLVLVTVLQHRGSFGLDWIDAGKMHAGLVRRGELWRTVTALTLHGDHVHLLANVVIGGLVGLFAGQVLGSGLAWVSILIGGAAGNLLTAFIRPAGHTSIGASTAVFAALGLLAAHGWVLRRKMRASNFVRHAPIIGAVVLLSYLGAGGERTDVLAHVMGFFAGGLLGLLYGWRGDRLPASRVVQQALGFAALAILALAWVSAARA